MVTTSHITKKLLKDKLFIQEALAKGLVNIGALAEYLQPDIERELGTKTKLAAISMSIRRFVEQNEEFIHKIQLSRKSNLLIKSNLYKISVLKSPNIYKKLIKLYEEVDFNQNDTLNIIQGNYEILIITNDQYKERFLEILKDETIKKTKENISSISIKIPQENIEHPGFYFAITKTFANENISILDIVNTETEATFLLEDKDISKTYDLLKKEISFEQYKK
jgi:aspartokinase